MVVLLVLNDRATGREWLWARRGWLCDCRRVVVGMSWVIVPLVVNGRALVVGGRATVGAWSCHCLAISRDYNTA